MPLFAISFYPFHNSVFLLFLYKNIQIFAYIKKMLYLCSRIITNTIYETQTILHVRISAIVGSGIR